MKILGITHPISWNNAACLLVDGQLVAMAEEERFTRVKHAPRAVPEQAIRFCLERGGLSLDDIDFIAIGFDRATRAALGNLRLGEGLSALNQAAHWLRDGRKYEQLLPFDSQDERLVFVNHHLAHAASTFLASGFAEANIISLDGSGGGESGILAIGRGDEIEIVHTVSNRGSWGLMYELITDALGFRRHSGEGKTMGLAAYGTPDPAGLPFVDWSGDIPEILPRRRQQFVEQLRRREEHEPLTQAHKDLAATTQDTLERAGQAMARYLYERTGLRRLCLAGGTALNCSMNGRLAQLDFVDDIFIQPAAHDAGTALGAALYVHTQKSGRRPAWRMTHAYWGAEYANEAIAAALASYPGIRYHLSSDICDETAEQLLAGRVVGWFQGRFEIGPRALGNRSILGNPTVPEMKDIINLKVKNREPWRPFAPSVLEEEVGRYIDVTVDSPFMILAFAANEEARSKIISATHVDGSCRPQTVSQATNPRYWSLIHSFGQKSGVPVVLNTSFNVKGQPIVNTPAEAIETFLSSGMEVLAIGDYLVFKDSGDGDK